MHELPITESIVKIALDKANEEQASKIYEIKLVLGELSGFVPDCIRFYFDFLSKDTIAENATLDFESVPAELRCRDCSTVSHPEDNEWICPNCHGWNVEILKGRELYIQSMEVE
ncbi:MAG: hydrogenase maturation nickel metallochaperone HypA [Dehalococcoidia bacterium]